MLCNCLSARDPVAVKTAIEVVLLDLELELERERYQRERTSLLRLSK
jgi:hypothetical protein